MTRSRPVFARLFSWLRTCLMALGLGLAAAPAAADLSEADTDQLRAMVRAYLLENPEVIIEALEIHQARQEELQAAKVQANLVHLYGTLTGDRRDPVMGNPDGDVTIVEFLDYQCGFCKRVAKDLFQVVEDDGNIRLVLKEFPILGATSTFAARAALAAGRQGLYTPLHKALLAHRGRLSESVVKQIAREIGADLTRLERDMDDTAVTTHLDSIQSTAQRLGVRGTPAFVIGMEIIPGAIDAAAIKAKIKAIRDGS